MDILIQLSFWQWVGLLALAAILTQCRLFEINVVRKEKD